MTLSVRPLADPELAVPLLRALRSTISDAVFRDRLTAALAGGYALLAAYDRDKVVGVLGYRLTDDICWGRTMYIDDLIADESRRGQGIGGLLIKAAQDLARQDSCDHMRLCSGLQRADAHRFYESHDLQKFSFQFVYALD